MCDNDPDNRAPCTTYNNGSVVPSGWNPTLIANRVTPGRILFLSSNQTWESINYGENWTCSYIIPDDCRFWWDDTFSSPKLVYGGCIIANNGTPECNPNLAIVPCGNNVFLRYDENDGNHWHIVNLPSKLFTEECAIAGISVDPRNWQYAYFLLYNASTVNAGIDGAWQVVDIVKGKFEISKKDGSVTLANASSILYNLPTVNKYWNWPYYSLYQIEVVPGLGGMYVIVGGKGGIGIFSNFFKPTWVWLNFPVAVFAATYQENVVPSPASAFSTLTLGTQGRGFWVLDFKNDLDKSSSWFNITW